MVLDLGDIIDKTLEVLFNVVAWPFRILEHSPDWVKGTLILLLALISFGVLIFIIKHRNAWKEVHY